MNKSILIGRLVKDPDVRYTSGNNSMAVARYTLAVDRPYAKDREQTTDFISCVAFGKSGEFAQKYLHKGTKIAIEGRIQTGSYEKDGRKVYTTDIVVEHHEFCESRNASGASGNNAPDADGFVSIPDSVEDEALPFN